MNQIRPSSSMPPVVRNLLIINGLMFLATLFLGNSGIDLISLLSLHYPSSPLFRPYQLVTYMFMHAGWQHIIFNMFALWMFGSMLENVWGPKRFLFFYLVCGLGAIAIHLGVTGFQLGQLQHTLNAFSTHPTPSGFDEFISKYSGKLTDAGMHEFSQVSTAFRQHPDDATAGNQAVILATSLTHEMESAIKDAPVLGASGAIFGLLVAFGMLFPNTVLYLMFIPIPIKAKYAVAGYALLELFLGVSGLEPDVAHFAHLGGALFGFLLVLYWNRTRRNDFY